MAQLRDISWYDTLQNSRSNNFPEEEKKRLTMRTATMQENTVLNGIRILHVYRWA